MSYSGKSVLLFLAGCMAFTDLVIGVLASMNENKPETTLLFGFLALAAILSALVVMYIRNPVFLLAQRDDLVSLSLIQSAAEQSNPELLRQLIGSFTPEALARKISVDEEAISDSEMIPVDVDEDEPSDPGQAVEFAAALQRLGGFAEGQE